MNRTTATCIIGIRRKTASGSKIHFQRQPDFRLFPFGVGSFATRLLASSERNPVVIAINLFALNARRSMLFSQHHQENKL